MMFSTQHIHSNQHLATLVFKQLERQLAIHGNEYGGYWFSGFGETEYEQERAQESVLEQAHHLLSMENGVASQLGIQLFGDAQLDIYDVSHLYKSYIDFVTALLCSHARFFSHHTWGRFHFELERPITQDEGWHQILNSFARHGAEKILPTDRRLELETILTLVRDGNTIIYLLQSPKALWIVDFCTS